MKAGGDEERLLLDDEEERVRKAAHQCTTGIAEDNRELERIRRDAADNCVDRVSEVSTESASLVLVPVLRLDQIRPRSLGEDDPKYLRTAAFELSFQFGPRYALAAIGVEGCQTSI